MKTIEMVNLLKEYQDMFSRDYKDFKGMVKKMGEMNIDLIPRARPIKKRPNKLAHKYK
jgi:ribosomal protein S17E